jgi:putative aldouronate transport system substrate-binding protein
MKRFSSLARLIAPAIALLALGAARSGAQAVNVSALPPVELNWYYTGPGPQKDVAMIEAAMSKITKKRINATIKLHALDWGSYDQKIQVLLASGEPIDLVMSCSWALQFNNAVARGWLRDLTPMFDKYAPETKKLFADSDWLKLISIDGKVYNLPCFKESASSAGILYNKDIAKRLGLDMSKVKTFADLESVFKKIREKDPTTVPLSVAYSANLDHVGMTYDVATCASTKLISLDPARDVWQLTPSNKKWLDWVDLGHRFYKAGYINQDAPTSRDYSAAIKNGTAFAFPAVLKPCMDGEASKSMGVGLGQLQLMKPISTQGDLTNSMMAIPTNSQNPERALMFYNLMYTDPDLVNIMDYGIEGVHWVWLDKAKKMIDFAPATEGGTKSGWNHGTNWMFGNQMLSYTFKGESPDKWDQYRAFNKSAQKSPDFGFVFDSEPVKKEMAAIANIGSEFDSLFYSGMGDSKDTVAAYVAKAKAAGIEKVIDEMNRQYAKFKASKRN